MNTLPPLHHAGYHNDAGEVKRLLTGGVVKDINYVCKYEPFWNGMIATMYTLFFGHEMLQFAGIQSLGR